MLIYKNTFENIKTIGLDFPIEDQFYADELKLLQMELQEIRLVYQTFL